ncbi:MAG: endonuclease III [Thermoguttaceae bacterium]|jgi:endonuclease-3|nr:endonuclease III [Thermoguttaceae bacterium]
MHDKPSSDRASIRRKVVAVCRRLARHYGPVEPPPEEPVLDELIATILSQNTSDTNSSAAFDELRRRFPDWNAVRTAPVGRIARAIRRAGLSNVKAPRIRAVLRRIHQERGELSLDFLRSWSAPEALAYLREFDGVGPKTAACVLLFACRMPVLPVDTHVHRVSRRLGLIGPGTNAEKAHDDLAARVPADRVLEFHLQLIRLGRTLCTARRPKCEMCPLWDLCPEGLHRLRAEAG